MNKIILFLAGALVSPFLLIAQSTDRIEASKSSCYGMTASGGNKGYGVVFSYSNSTGKESVLDNAVDAVSGTIFGAPKASTLFHASNGLFYGTSQYGGLFGLGGIFSFDPLTGKDTMIVSFNWVNGDDPQGGLMQASNGLIYGMTEYGGLSGTGVLFSYDPITGNDSVLVNFNRQSGQSPFYGNLVQAYNGKLYGMLQSGGFYNKGVIFSYDIAAKKDSVVYNLDSTHGRSPYGGLILGKDSMLYGMTANGGAKDSGVIFRFNPYTNTDSVLFSFNKASGAIPFGSFMQASNGWLYAMTSTGGANNMGTMFCFNYVTNTDSVLVNFNGTNGKAPNGDDKLIQASNGILYGMTANGGNSTFPYGVLFSYNPTNGTDSVLEEFTDGHPGGVAGRLPFDGLMQDTTSGLLYGVTQWGGAYTYGGILFSYDIKTQTFTNVTSLGGSSSNNSYIMQADNGMIYGMTSYGGTNSQGTIFEFNPVTNISTIQYSFDFAHGAAPYGKLVQAADSNLYGTTSHGDTDNVHNFGTLFKFNPSTNQETTLLNFVVDSGAVGVEPHCNLIQASDKLLYGTTMRGPGAGSGTLFSFNTLNPHKANTLLKFNDTNGSTPCWGVMQAKNKLLYGMTLLGGTYHKGVLYSYNTVSHVDSVLVNFNDTNGAFPFGGLLQSSVNGSLYGVASSGGANHHGVLFRFYPGTKADSIVLQFNGLNGSFPMNTLAQDSLGILYGTTRYGGTFNNGVLFKFDPTTKKDSVLINFRADSGAFPSNIIFLNPIPTAIQTVQKPGELIIVYPNPFSDMARVLFTTTEEHYIELDDINGKRLRWIKTADRQYTIARNGLPAAMYIVKFYDGNKNYLSSTKIVVQ